ncbi:MAG: hypothetical protein KDA20_06605 [Phycisphaerales bacterium]|nr:hypothetical protein [Phycisphaerales bacterium]
MNDQAEPMQAAWRGSRRVAVGVAGAGLVCIWCACSVERNYELLSFFFDGVPNPRALPIASASGDPTLMRQSATYVVHAPFRDERCVECHGTSFNMEGVESNVCLKCHEEEQTRYPVMHGPVAATACLWCHAAHESAFAHLLKAPVRDVCFQCHEIEQLDTERVPEHADAEVSCIACHSGHGGDQRYMLHSAGSGAKPEGSSGAKGGG